jgi:hypothetical protein
VREPRDWDEEYLIGLAPGEFDWLEAKGRRGLDLTLANVHEAAVKENLSRAVSAFANSGGGALVLGIISSPTGSRDIDDGGINLLIKNPSTREWLEDIIPHLVDAPLTKFNVYCIQQSTAASRIQSGRGVFIVHVQDSDQAPHQASDNRYYIRVAGRSRPIGHRLVLDILGRRRDPIIEMQFAVLERGSRAAQDRVVRLTAEARNVGAVYAQYLACFIYIPQALVPESRRGADYKMIDGNAYYTWRTDNTRRDLLKHELNGFGFPRRPEYGPSWFHPILPSLTHTWEWDMPADVDLASASDERILWEVHVDNAPVRTGVVTLCDVPCHS